MKNVFKQQFISHNLLVFSLIAFCFANSTAAQTSGSLDTTFGNSGTTFTTVPTTDGNLFPRRAIMQSDGKVLALYDSHLNTGNGFTDVLIRFDTDGSLDSTFGSGGFLLMNWNGANNAYGASYAIALQTVGAEEKIIVAGSNPATGLRVDRYDANGSADLTFGTNGTALINAGYALTVTIQPDGKILTMGDVGDLVRLNSSGTLDASFGSGGIVATGLKGYGLVVQSSGRILVAATFPSKGKNALTVARFNLNGTADDGGRRDSTPGDAFGTSGKTTIEFFVGGTSGGDTRNDWIKLDASGKILFSAQATAKNSTNGQIGVARLTANGQFDTTFDGDGKATADFTANNDSPRSIALQADGKIILTGVAGYGAANPNLGMTRLNANGSLDTGFGTSGVVINDFSPTAEWNHVGRIQFDPACICEKIVTVGSAELGGIDYAVAARYFLQ